MESSAKPINTNFKVGIKVDLTEEEQVTWIAHTRRTREKKTEWSNPQANSFTKERQVLFCFSAITCTRDPLCCVDISRPLVLVTIIYIYRLSIDYNHGSF